MMGYPCDDCGKQLDTNLGTYEYHLEDTGQTHLCFDCRAIRVKNGTFVYSWKEGWMKPKHGRVYHYYEGRVWKGGLTTRPSRCKRSSYPHRDLLNGLKVSEEKKCKKCLDSLRYG